MRYFLKQLWYSVVYVISLKKKQKNINNENKLYQVKKFCCLLQISNKHDLLAWWNQSVCFTKTIWCQVRTLYMINGGFYLFCRRNKITKLSLEEKKEERMVIRFFFPLLFLFTDFGRKIREFKNLQTLLIFAASSFSSGEVISSILGNR